MWLVHPSTCYTMNFLSLKAFVYNSKNSEDAKTCEFGHGRFRVLESDKEKKEYKTNLPKLQCYLLMYNPYSLKSILTNELLIHIRIIFKRSLLGMF